MGHPDLLMIANSVEQHRIAVTAQVEDCQPKLTFVAFADGSAQQMRDEVVSVADAENRNARGQHRSLYDRTGIVVDAVRATRNDDAHGMPQLFKRCFAREHFGRNSEFPYFTSDKVAVLTAGVEYGYLRQIRYFRLLSHSLDYD